MKHSHLFIHHVLKKGWMLVMVLAGHSKNLFQNKISQNKKYKSIKIPYILDDFDSQKYRIILKNSLEFCGTLPSNIPSLASLSPLNI